MIEDVRIDKKNFSLLPNIIGFYQKFLEKQHEKNKGIDMKDVPLENKVLFNAIMELERFSSFKIPDKEAENFARDNNVYNIIDSACWNLDCGSWESVKKGIAELMKIFKWDKKKEEPRARAWR